jgi:hypothetical protein
MWSFCKQHGRLKCTCVASLSVLAGPASPLAPWLAALPSVSLTVLTSSWRPCDSASPQPSPRTKGISYSQPGRQAVSQSGCEAASQSGCETPRQAVKQSVRQAARQSVSQAVRQSVRQAARQFVSQM